VKYEKGDYSMCKPTKITVLSMALLLIFTLAYSQSEASDSKKWEFQVTPYFFAPSVDADTTVDGATVPLDLSFSDILDDFDVFGLSARVEANKGKWGFIFDGMYIDLDGDFSIEIPPPITGVDVDIEQTVLDFAVSYRVVETPKLVFDPIVGARYTYLKQKINLNGNHPIVGPIGTELGQSEQWFEPFIGAKLAYILTEKWTLLFRGDVGGFGIGSASELTWNLLAGVDFRPWQRASFKFAYRIYNLDYETGSGTNKFGFDGTLHGPMLGVTFYF
jgi:hypothetical protein